MFSRAKLLFSLVKSSRLPLLRSSFKPVSFSIPSKTLHFTPCRTYLERSYLGDDTDYRFAQEVLQAFVSRQSTEPEAIIHTLSELEQFQMGIVSSESIYRNFIALVVQGLSKDISSIHLELIGTKARNIRIKTPVFWGAYLQAIRKANDRLEVGSLISIYDLMIREKEYADLVSFVSTKISSLQKRIDQHVERLHLIHLIKALYIFSYFDVENKALRIRFLEEVTKSLPELESLISANEMAVIALLVHNMPTESEEMKYFEKDRILADISRVFVSRDVLEYDSRLKEYEYGNTLPGQAGISDPLKWESIATMLRVYSQEDSFDEMTIDRMKEAIYRKSETDLIDFENAVVILSVFGNTKHSHNDNDVFMRVVEMVNWQFESEDVESMIKQLNEKNIVYFLDALVKLYNTEFDPELLNDSFNFVAGVVLSGQLDSKLTSESCKNLIAVFQRGKKFARFDEGIFDYLRGKL